jgi:hypothetical protein
MPSNTMREAEFDVSPIRAATGAVTLLRPHTHHRNSCRSWRRCLSTAAAEGRALRERVG